MAFVCQSCRAKERSFDRKRIGKKAAAEEFSWRPTSFGPCEDCRKTRRCINT